MFVFQETPIDHVVEDGEQGVVVAGDVEETAGFSVLAELRPGKNLEELFERAGAAGERDEPFGELGHRGLALVHRADDVCRRVRPVWAI
jgi:hypothetical protein